MKLKIKNTPEQVALVKEMASKDRLKAMAAQESFAELLAPTLGQVLQQIDTTTLIYEDMPYNENTDPTIPLEPLLNQPEGLFSVWSQGTPGGLPTNNIFEPIQEVRFTTYKVDSAVSWLRKYAKDARLDIIGKYLERLLQEILVKQSRNAWSLVLAALANASYNGIQNVWRAGTAANVTLDDINKMFTRIKRQNMSWAGGSIASEGLGGLTDLVVSPEIMEYIRSIAFNPINTRGANVVAGTQYSGVIAAPDDVREAVFNGGGLPSIFGVNLIELYELGKGQKYNVLFDEMAGSTTYAKYDGTTGAAAFDASTEEVLIGLNLSAPAFAHRAIETNSETGATFTLMPDDQFYASRSERIGQYGQSKNGWLVTSSRPMSGLIV